MAMQMWNISRSTINLLGKNFFKQLVVNAARPLYSEQSMGINGYLNARDYVKSQFLNVDHLFFDKMRKFIDQKDSMIFTEDLKTILHLIEKKPEDIELMYKMIKKYHTENNLRFGSFIFGTVVMRALYHLDEPEIALKMFKDPELTNFFDQIMTHQLLLDLLYNHERYQDVREVYSIIKTKNINGVVNPTNPFIITMGACYKENTAESFEYAINLFKEAQIKGYQFPRRGIIFLAALALKQNSPNVALEVASVARNVRYIDIRCIKIQAYALLKRFDEVLIYFRNSLQDDLPTRRKQSFFKDTIEQVEAILRENSAETADHIKMLEQLKLHEFVQLQTLDEHITSTIEQIKHTDQKPWAKDDFKQRKNFRKERTERPGLRDIV